MEVPAFLERSRVFDCHPHILAEMLGPSGYKVFETKQAGLVQALVESALERAVASANSLHLLHEQPELFAILAIDLVINRYGNRPLIGIGNDG